GPVGQHRDELLEIGAGAVGIADSGDYHCPDPRGRGRRPPSLRQLLVGLQVHRAAALRTVDRDKRDMAAFFVVDGHAVSFSSPGSLARASAWRLILPASVRPRSSTNSMLRGAL